MGRILSFIGFVTLVYACSSGRPSVTPDEPTAVKGYSECRKELDKNRLEARKMGHYSYSNESYIDCMRPLRVEQDLKEWQYPPRRESPYPPEPPRPAFPRVPPTGQ